MKNIKDYFGTKTAIKCENEQQFRDVCNLLGVLSIPDFDLSYNCVIIRKEGLARIREQNIAYTYLPYSDFVCDVPELVGVEMEVSQDRKEWYKRIIYGKCEFGYVAKDATKEGVYLWIHARPITKKVLTATLQELAEMLNYDEIELKK